MAGIIAQLPEGETRFLRVDRELLACSPSEVADRVRLALDEVLFHPKCCAEDQDELEEVDDLLQAFQRFHVDVEDDESALTGDPLDEDEDDYRVLFQGRDLEVEKSAIAFLSAMNAGRPCFVRVSFRLLGGTLAKS
eukprot:g7304.t1